MSEHTPTPWIVSSAICGEHNTETVSIYHYPREAVCYEVVETGCKCDDEALTEADARHIVHCVNNHERLAEALRSLISAIDNIGGEHCEGLIVAEKKAAKAEALLAQLQRSDNNE